MGCILFLMFLFGFLLLIFISRVLILSLLKVSQKIKPQTTWVFGFPNKKKKRLSGNSLKISVCILEIYVGDVVIVVVVTVDVWVN